MTWLCPGDGILQSLGFGPQDVNVDTREPADDLACGVTRHPSVPASMSEDHFGGKRLVNVVNERARHGSAMQVDELASKLMR